MSLRTIFDLYLLQSIGKGDIVCPVGLRGTGGRTRIYFDDLFSRAHTLET